MIASLPQISRRNFNGEAGFIANQPRCAHATSGAPPVYGRSARGRQNLQWSVDKGQQLCNGQQETMVRRDGGTRESVAYMGHSHATGGKLFYLRPMYGPSDCCTQALEKRVPGVTPSTCPVHGRSGAAEDLQPRNCGWL
jgi:hypothetical protein